MGTDDTWLDERGDEAPSAPRVGGRYAVLGLVGEGGVGTVYRARDLELDEIVALKVVRRDRAGDPAMLARLRHEVRLARRVTHANVVRTFDLGEEGTTRFVTMEYVDGGSLAEALADEGRLAPRVARHVAIELCRGLEAAHAAGIVHRDLKPANVMLGRRAADGLPVRVAIADFGVAGAPGSEGVAGTPAYMAPEQRSGEAVDPRTDLYALGAILVEMVTGVRPLGADDTTLGLAPTPLAEIARRCLDPSRDRRPADAASVRAALERVDAGPDGRPTVGARPSARAVSLEVGPFETGGADRWLGRSLASELVEILTRSRSILARRGGTPGAPRSDARVVGTVERAGDRLVLALRVVTAEDGFVLLDERAEAAEEDAMRLLERVAARVAQVLVVDLEPGHRIAARGDLVADWLRARDLLRGGWRASDLDEPRRLVEGLLAQAPDDPALVATHAQILARVAFGAEGVEAERAAMADARRAADRALALAPDDGEAHLARAIVALYSGAPENGAASLRRALERAPSSVRLQTFVGSILLEVGALDAAERHLEAAIAIDPHHADARNERARLAAYRGRWDRVDADAGVGRDVVGVAFARHRFRLWSPAAPPAPDPTPAELAAIGVDAWFAWAYRGFVAHRDGRPLPEPERTREVATVPNARLRAARCQHQAELLAVAGLRDAALATVEIAVRAGCIDVQWMDHCPPLAEVRADPRFGPLRDEVAARAAVVRDALLAR